MYLGGVNKVLSSAGASPILLNAETTIYTHSFELYLGLFFGVWIKATSVLGTPNIKVELEESWSRPTTEGSAETTLWVEPTGFSDIYAQINDEIAHIISISPVPMPFGRYKITGLTGNPADTLITIYNFIQEQN